MRIRVCACAYTRLRIMRPCARLQAPERLQAHYTPEPTSPPLVSLLRALMLSLASFPVFWLTSNHFLAFTSPYQYDPVCVRTQARAYTHACIMRPCAHTHAYAYAYTHNALLIPVINLTTP